MIFIHSFFFCNLCLYNVYIFIDMKLLLMFYVKLIYKKQWNIINIITKFLNFTDIKILFLFLQFVEHVSSKIQVIQIINIKNTPIEHINVSE